MLMPVLSSGGVFGTSPQTTGEPAGTAFAQLLALLQAPDGSGESLLPADALLAAQAALLDQAAATDDGASTETISADTVTDLLKGLPPEAAALLATLIPVNTPELSYDAPAPAALLQSVNPAVTEVAQAPQGGPVVVTATDVRTAPEVPASVTAIPAPVTNQATAVQPQGTAVVEPARSAPVTAAAVESPQPAEQRPAAAQPAVTLVEAPRQQPVLMVLAQATVTDVRVTRATGATAPVAVSAAPATAPAEATARPSQDAKVVASPAPEGVVATADPAHNPARPVLRQVDLLPTAPPRRESASTLATADPAAPDQQTVMPSLSQPPVKDAGTPATAQAAAATPVALSEVEAQAVKVVRLMVQEGEQRVTLRLVPEHLGELRIEVRSHGDQVSVKMLSANASVRDALEAQLHGLREAFAREGLSVQRVEVTPGAPALQTSAGGGQAGREAAYQPGNRGQQGSQPGQQTSYPQPSSYTPRRAATAHLGSLNVFV
ncbi:MAG: flagellar hook-length control protein FliK [Candidatus Hydrogenedentes bacterium]|nr:flagellar hook-length control protein FliK [Candidatus Hydrogenedentota bacterium]